MYNNEITTRECPILLHKTAILFVDAQKYNCTREGKQYSGLDATEFERRYGYFFRRLEGEVINNWAALAQCAREIGMETTFTVIESLTRDGRDRSLDYKISGFNIPKNSRDGQVIDAIEPLDDEMVFKKSSSSVFISTNINYIFNNMGIKSVILAGVLTDQCIDSAARDACDLGYLVTIVTDACATHTQDRHDWSLKNNRGYARQVTTADLLREMKAVYAAGHDKMGRDEK
ncbi:cysteine hydrolase [Komagataeibacter xylinus]|uniref:Cysteine hydrolase n=1 Tax=Komagataeibacter xylinus TaxID=28448 RepID=A0A318Q546_KOMXY|nr:isochorismatase family cysteine hydrolase [Komagataeibacter xylinus]PYD57968.1 cysteine hydrolase [Komagataeibacter xylinus]GBQ73959.1 isochorismatase [Komagataeibacter xylinus NBRC 15237]